MTLAPDHAFIDQCWRTVPRSRFNTQLAQFHGLEWTANQPFHENILLKWS